METLKLLRTVRDSIQTPNKECLELSLNNVHAEGLFSLVVKNTEFGKLVRIFIADKKLNPFDVQLHTHRYPIRLTAIKGRIIQHVAKEVDYSDVSTVKISKYDYKSFLNGGNGLNYENDIYVSLSEFVMPKGSQINMNCQEFHTISCSKGSIWIAEELGFETESSKVLGVPFVFDLLYSKPEMFQVNDKCQIVLKEVRQMMKDYESCIV